MSNYLVDGADLTSIANAIRTKGGTSAQLAFPAGFVSAIGAIPTGGGGLSYDTGTFTLAEDTKSINSGGIPHNLGKVPKCVVVWTEDYDTQNPPSVEVNVGYIWIDRIVDMDQRLTSAASTPNGIYAGMYIAANASVISPFVPTSTAYALDQTTLPSSSALFLPVMGSTYYWRAGVTYHYFVSEAWWA